MKQDQSIYQCITIYVLLNFFFGIYMPYKIVRKGNKFGVWNKEKKIWKAKSTTKEKAEKQIRFLNYIEHKKS